MNVDQISRHIGECFPLLINSKYPAMKVVVLLHDNEDDNISMISNFIEIEQVFEVLTRSMISCFEPIPASEFISTCRQFLQSIKPAFASLDQKAESVVCFWDHKTRLSAMISSLNNSPVAFAIICEHMYRTISAGISAEKETIH